MVYRCPLSILHKIFITLSAVIAAAPWAAAGQRAPAAPTIQIAAKPLEGSPPTIDGTVDDEAWLQVEPYTNFIQTDPIEGDPASERTEVRVLFDRANLYISVIAFDRLPLWATGLLGSLRIGQSYVKAIRGLARHERQTSLDDAQIDRAG